MSGFYRGLHKKILSCSVTSIGIFVGVSTDLTNRFRLVRYDTKTMSNVYNLQVCLVLLLVRASGTNDAKKMITCHGGTFAPGSPAAITCNFHTDLSVAKQGVNVVRYQRDETQGNTDTNILVCKWEDNQNKCDVVASGYTFNNTMQDPFTLTIPAVSEEFAGLYMCFIVPPGDTDTQACDLIVKEMTEIGNSSPETPKLNKTGENEHVVVIVVVVIVAAISWILLVVVVFVFKRRRSNRHEEAALCDGRHNEEEVLPLVVLPGEQEQQRNPKIEELVSRFRLTTDDLRGIMRVFSNEAEAGLRQREEAARVKVYPTYLHSMPDGNERGDYLVVNLGSTTLKIMLIKLGAGNFLITSHNYKIEDEIRLGTQIKLFQFIADSVKTFLREHNLTEQRLPLAFVFSFTCEHYEGTDLTKARLVKWAKGFGCSGVVGKDVGRLLQDSLRMNLATNRLEMKAVINDVVGVLVSLAHKDPDCLIGLVFGNGFNACYIQEETHDVSEGVAENHSYTVIKTTEWGSVGENGCLDPFRTEFDTDLDALSANRKEQTLEKMVSKAYIGEIARLVLSKLISSGLLFTSNEAECHALEKRGAFSTDYVSLIENDNNRGHVNTKFVLKQLGMENYTEEDCSTVSYVCGLISERSAHLAAAALAALINSLNKSDITIAVDGSLYRSHARFRDRLYAKTKELINEGLTFTLKPSLNGSSKGAALIAAASPHQAQ